MSNSKFFGDGADTGIRGVAVGIVTDNEDPNGMGRVKLQYPWREADDESYWARIATEMAADGYGTYFLPEVGDEVLVAFEDGDIHYPYVIGSLWSGEASPPVENEGDNDVREVKSRSGHAIDLDDTDGEEKVKIETSAGHTITLDDTGGSEKVTVEDKSGNNTIEMDSTSGEVSIEGSQKISLSAPQVEIEGSSEVSVSSDGKVSASSNGQMELSSSQMKLSSKGQLKMSSSGVVTIQGSLIQLN